jgi:cysteinyl-tRNA synthetase
VPVHHTNEIAQSEAATGKHPWVKYWVHNEFLVLDKGKMAKSAGGFITLQNLVDAGCDPLDYRYFLLGGHYRSQLRFSWESLETAKNARRSLGERIRVLAQKAGPERIPGLVRGEGPGRAGESGFSERAGACLAAFDRALTDDLSSPRALAELWGLLRDPALEAGEALACAFDMDRVLGLGLAGIAGALGAENSGEEGEEEQRIARLIAERTEAKKARDYAKADSIRAGLKEQGILLEDGPEATVWRRIRDRNSPRA